MNNKNPAVIDGFPVMLTGFFSNFNVSILKKSNIIFSIGCGKCVVDCNIEAIKIVDGRAVRSDASRPCGRCAVVRPKDADRLTLYHPKYEEEVIKRSEAFVDVT